MDNRPSDVFPAPKWAGRALGVIALVMGGIVVFLGVKFGFVRALVAAAICGAILFLGGSYFRNAGLYPPEPELADVSEYGLKYVCTMCGLELKVEVAAKDKAPSHCMEPMVLVRTGGRPPLTTVD